MDEEVNRLRRAIDALNRGRRERIPDTIWAAVKAPLSGDCLLFVKRDRTRAQVLLWDGAG